MDPIAQLVEQPAAPTSQPTPSPLQPTGEGNQVAPVATQPTATPAVPLDPSIVNLAKAIRTQETGAQGNFTAIGASGEYGAYQFTQPTWDAVKGFAGVQSEYNQSTPQEQNAVAYAYIKSLKAQGYNVGQIASIWNSGKPDPTGNVGTNASGVAYNTPQYVQNVWNNYQALKNQTAPSQTTTTPQSPSLEGFAQNVIGSGASFLGNVGSALLHPLTTLQNLASIPVGALQELGGESTPETQTFDAIKQQEVNRYGSLNAVANTFYTDPIGMLADISAVAGGAGLIAGGVSKLADVANLGTVASDATEASGVAGGASSLAQTLNKVSAMANPLTPLIKGGIALAGKAVPVATETAGQVLGMNPQDITNIMTNPEKFTPEQIATVSRVGLSQEVAGALGAKIDSLSETGAGYEPLRATPVPMTVAPDFLDNAFRQAGVTVTDGVVSADSSSAIRASGDVAKLQGLYNLYKPDFLNGTMDSNKFLNLRADLAQMAYNDSGFKSTALASAGESIRSSLNDTYRPQIPNLEETDASYSAQTAELKTLSKGLIDKNGNLLDSAINKIANATGKGKDPFLARLEQILPGITDRIKILRTIENIQNMGGIKVGTYTRSLAQAARVGGILYGGATGNVHLLAGAIAMDFISQPDTAMELLRTAAKINPTVVNSTMATLARYAVIGGSSLNTSSVPPTSQTPQNTAPPPATAQTSVQPASPETPTSVSSSLPQSITSSPQYQAAIQAGYTPQQIQAYLNSQ